MHINDWILTALLLLSLLYGWRKGTIRVLGDAGAVILAYIAAHRYSLLVATYLVEKLNINISLDASANSEALLAFLSLFINTDRMVNLFLQIVVSIVIFVLVCWVIKWLARTVSSLFGSGLLGSVNRALGAFLALVICVLLVFVAADIVLPALEGMGIAGQSTFFDDSQVVMPLLNAFRG